MYFLHIAFFIQFPLLEDVSYMAGDNRLISGEQNSHLLLVQPDAFLIKLDLKPCITVLGLKQNNFIMVMLLRFHVPSLF